MASECRALVLHLTTKHTGVRLPPARPWSGVSILADIGEYDVEILDYAETAAKENAAFHIANADALARESNALMNMLLAGAAGSLAYLVTLSDKGAAMWLKAGMGAMAAYLFIVAATLLYKCLHIRPIWPPANEPKNLTPDGFDVGSVRRAELKNRQACIDANRDRNDSVGMWLNRCRAMATATPIVFAVAAWVAAC